MKIGFHAPLPPQHTGVADYAAALLAGLRRRDDVEPGATRADAHLYHLGNNQLHRGIYARALREPGVIVLHDAVLQHFFLGSLDEAGYVAEFVYNYGEWHRDLARDLWRGRHNSATAGIYYRYPMLKRVVEASRAVVVHNPGAARMVREHVPGARVVEIPHLFEAPAMPAEADTARFRHSLGIPLGAAVFGLFGYLRESKRLLPVLRAFAALHRGVSRVRLLVAGEFVSRDLARAAAPLLASPGVVRLPYLTESDFRLAAAATDAAICLRHPPAGETSGITIRMMGIGRAVLLGDSAENSRFPQTACLRVMEGIAERAALVEHMVIVAHFPAVAGEIGRRAAVHIARHHALDRVSELYWNVLCA